MPGVNNGRMKITPTPPSPVEGEGYRKGVFSYIMMMTAATAIGAAVFHIYG